MASQLFPEGAAHILGKATKVDLAADDIKILFYSGSITTTWEFHSSLTGGSIVATSGNLSGKTVALGVFDANNITLTAVSGSAFTHVIVFKDSGSSATSPLICVFDVASFTPTGSDVNVVWHSSGLFSIA